MEKMTIMESICKSIFEKTMYVFEDIRYGFENNKTLVVNENNRLVLMADYVEIYTSYKAWLDNWVGTIDSDVKNETIYLTNIEYINIYFLYKEQHSYKIQNIHKYLIKQGELK